MANWHPAVAAAQGQPGRWLRTDQVADRLRLKERRIRQLCESGILPGVKTGRKWWIPESALQEYLSSLNQQQFA
jgi:excisionase family DNA binding protein